MVIPEKLPTDAAARRKRRMEMNMERDEDPEPPSRTANYEIKGLDKRLRRWAQNTAVERFELDVNDTSDVVTYDFLIDWSFQ